MFAYIFAYFAYMFACFTYIRAYIAYHVAYIAYMLRIFRVFSVFSYVPCQGTELRGDYLVRPSGVCCGLQKVVILARLSDISENCYRKTQGIWNDHVKNPSEIIGQFQKYQ